MLLRSSRCVIVRRSGVVEHYPAKMARRMEKSLRRGDVLTVEKPCGPGDWIVARNVHGEEK
jgi:hypothetical protein